MTEHHARTVEDELLARAAEDWVHPGQLFNILQDAGIADERLRLMAAIGLVASLLSRGLIVVGDVWDSHVPWDCSPGDAVLRLAREWVARPDPNVMPGDLFWIDTTPEGQAVGEAVLDRERDAH